jgi:3-oxoacid CoA-transferase B subunit
VIAGRVAARLAAGEIVNLGIGMPTLVADHLGPDQQVFLQSENGILGVGPTPAPGAEEPLLINAGKQPVTVRPGASFCSSSQSFGLIRGGRIDVAVLGALQVDGRGLLANWALPGRPVLGVGGAMDLLVGARRVIVATEHLTKKGEAKIVEECTFPLTGDRAVDVIVTERVTFEVRNGGLVLTELANDVDVGWVRSHTGARFDEDLVSVAASLGSA